MTGASDPPRNGLADSVSLDALFRANAAARPDAIALVDPFNRESFTDGAPLRLTYTEVDERIDRLSRRLTSFAMPGGSVVAVQLPTLAEAIISLLAISRSGLVTAPVPMLWRRSDLVAALGSVAPKAMICLSRFNDERPAEIVCEAAAELFDLSFPCAFGADVPDGVVALDHNDAHEGASPSPSAHAKADAVSLVTFDTDADGFFAAGRNDAQWLAAGLAVFLEAKMKSGDTIVTTVPLNSLAGIAGAFVPWLLCGGTLELIHGHAPEAVGAAGANKRAHLVGPAAALTEITRQRRMPFTSCIAVHRGASRHDGDLSNVPSERIVDFHSFGETAVIAIVRDERRHVRAIPLGGISAPSAAVGAPIVVETRIAEGQVWLRGPIIPRLQFPATGDVSRLKQDGDGFVRTGFRCHSDGNGGLIVEAGPERVVSVGGLRFGLNDLRLRFSACGNDIKVTAVDDPLLGQRLHIEAANPDEAIAVMRAAGHSRLMIDATVESGSRPATS